MGLVTVGLIMFVGWMSIVVAVLAMCKAAAHADATSASYHPRLQPSQQRARAERSRRFETPALN